jgi:hypothetical protein
MEDPENWLTGVGSEQAPRSNEGWCVARVGAAAPRRRARPAGQVRDPGGRILHVWLNRLRDNDSFSPYRICREG